MRDRRWAVPVVWVSGCLILTVAWALASRPFSAPDESAHFVRAVGIAQGSLLGPRAQRSVGTPLPSEGPVIPSQRQFEQANTRAYRVPGALSPADARCSTPASAPSSGCLEGSYTGDYLPLSYAVPALAIKAAGHLPLAGWLSRIAALLVADAFLLIAVAAIWNGRVISLAGILLAATPMVLYETSVLNPTGLEFTANLALIACLLRLSRDGRVSRTLGLGLAVSGAGTVLAWQPGPLFLILDVLAVGLLFGSPAARRAFVDVRRALAPVIVVWGLALAGWVAWTLAVGSDGVGVSISDGLGIGAHNLLDHQLAQPILYSVGRFGYLDVPLPGWFEALWLVAIAGLLISAVLVARWRDRFALLGVSLGVVVYPAGFYVLAYASSGFTMQARYVMPVLCLVPVLAGEVWTRSARAEARPGLERGVLSGLGLLQLVAWYVNAKASAGSSTLGLGQSATWSPPLGWAPWGAVALLGGVALMSAPWAARRRAGSIEV